MLDELRAWLNGSREYLPGVLLYNQLGDNAGLKSLFAKGKTEYCYKRLQSELMAICIDLKNKLNGTSNNEENSASTDKGTASEKKPGDGHQPADQSGVLISPPGEKQPGNANPELYAACKLEADKVYKETMNARAVLFSMVPSELYHDPNRPDLIEARRELSLKVVNGYKNASRLYDRADHVKINGKLPDDPGTNDDLDKIPDHLVKSKLDNVRKNYNKIKSRPQTAERIALLQQHKSDIEKLEARWLSLKPTK